AVLCVFYYPIVAVYPEVFRPDLALYHQSSASYGPGGTVASPSQWNTLLYDLRIPRFVGTFPNPILFGYFAAVLSFALYINRRYIVSGAMAVLVVISLSKGAMLLLLSSHALFIVLTHARRIFFPIVGIMVAMELVAAYLLDGSNRVHLRGLL